MAHNVLYKIAFLALCGLALAGAADATNFGRRVSGGHGSNPKITSLTLDNLSFVPNGSTAVDVGNIQFTSDSGSPATITLASAGISGCGDTASFQITNGGLLPAKVQAKSTTTVGTYHICLVAAQSGVTNSPFTSGSLTLTGSTGALWADPPGMATASSGVDILPSIMQPSVTGDIVGVRFQNVSTSPTPAGYHTFGHPFRTGDLTASDSIHFRDVGGTSRYGQIDQPTTNNGSLIHADLTINLPSIPASPANCTANNNCNFVDFMIAKGAVTAPSPAAPSATALRDNGYDDSASFVFHDPSSNISTGTGSASCHTALANAIAGTALPDGEANPGVTNWLSGPGVNEFRVVTTVADTSSGVLRIICDIRAYAGGAVKTDYILDNSWLFKTPRADMQYDVAFSDGTTFNAANAKGGTGVKHPLYTMWHHETYTGTIPLPVEVASTSGSPIGTLNPQFDIPYWIATKLIHPYDFSYGIAHVKTSTDLTIVLTNTAPNGNTTGNGIGPLAGASAGINPQDAQGGRDDLAPQPGWMTNWLMGQNSDARRLMWYNAETGGSGPWHLTDESTLQPVNTETYMGLAWNNNETQTVPPNGIVTTGGNQVHGNSWIGGTGFWAHLTDFNYVRYLALGNHFDLDLLKHQGAFAVFGAVHYGTGSANGQDVTTTGIRLNWASLDANELRGQSWSLRVLSDAAVITPDADSFKTHLQNEVTIGMYGLNYLYNTYGWTQGGAGIGNFGALVGFIQVWCCSFFGAYNPWQGDFFQSSMQFIYDNSFPTLNVRTGRGANVATVNANASTLSAQMLAFTNEFYSGRFTNGQNGFNPLVGTGYAESLADPNTTVAKTTWAQYQTDNGVPYPGNTSGTICVDYWTNNCGGVPVVYPPPNPLINGCQNDPNIDPTGEGGYRHGYAEMAAVGSGRNFNILRASGAAIAKYVKAAKAYAFTRSRVVQCHVFAGNSQSEVNDLQWFSQWRIAPRMLDGQILLGSHIIPFVDSTNGASVTKICPSDGLDCFVGIVGSGTASLTTANGPTNIAVCDSGTCTVQAGSGDNYIFGGSGAMTAIVGAGTQYMESGAILTAASPSIAAAIYQYPNTVAATTQDNIGNFRPGTDKLKVQARTGIATAADALAKCTGNPAICNWGTGQKQVKLTGVNATSLGTGDFVIY